MSLTAVVQFAQIKTNSSHIELIFQSTTPTVLGLQETPVLHLTTTKQITYLHLLYVFFLAGNIVYNISSFVFTQ